MLPWTEYPEDSFTFRFYFWPTFIFNSALWLQVEIMEQLSGQMAEIMGGVVETFGEEPQYNTDLNTQQYEEEEELTKVTI